MDHPRDRRHLTVSLLIRWGCALLVPGCIWGHEPLFSQVRLWALISHIYPMYYTSHSLLTLTSDLALPLLGVPVYDISSASSVKSHPR
jgi:hypothetical protein